MEESIFQIMPMEKNNIMVNNKILILGSLPYKPNAQSRAFDSYFHYWKKDNLHQFFSSPYRPVRGHCSQFYQITDYQMLKRNFKRNIEVGHVFNDDELNDFQDQQIDSAVSKLYKSGKHKTPLKRLLRKIIWKERYWCTKEFIKWIEDFCPDIVFLAWSDDFYMLDIAYFVCTKYKLPLISCIGDDYYFNMHFSLSPFYWIYKIMYRRMAKKVLKLKGSHVYIGDKIKNKYNDFFCISGETIHVACDLEKMQAHIPSEFSSLVYFGNLGYGRYKTLITLANLLNKRNESIKIHIYSNVQSDRILAKIRKNKHIEFHGSIPYAEIKNKVINYDGVIIAEELSNKNIIKDVKYSLSTKVGDSLSFGVPIIAVGNIECGAIEFIKKTNTGIVLTSKKDISRFSFADLDFNDIKAMINNSALLLDKEFNKGESCNTFEKIVKTALELKK